MEELTTIEEQETTTQEATQEQETQETENQKSVIQETETQEQEESLSDSETVEALPDNSENMIHELFAELGVNLDYTPVNNFQCFTMSLQFIAALWFICWLVKYMFKFMCNMMSPRW